MPIDFAIIIILYKYYLVNIEVSPQKSYNKTVMPEQNDLTKEREEKLAEARRRGEETKAEHEAQKLGLPYLNLALVPLDHDNLNLIPRAEAERARLIVIRREKNILKVGAVEPANAETKQIIERLQRQKFKVEQYFISSSSLARALKEYEKIPAPTARKEVAGAVSLETVKEKIRNFNELVAHLKKLGDGETSELFELLLASALNSEASDIHIEPEEQAVKVRLRLDGILQEAGVLSAAAYKLLLSRAKLTAGVQLNVTEKPQDGRFSVKAKDEEVEVRTSVFPGPYGEYIVLRVLNPAAVGLEVKDLGLRDELWANIKTEIEKPNGVVLVTGPTGSGKTTTLYAFLRHLLRPGLKIVTLEDPIEYHLEGVSQSQIETEKGFTFLEGIRAGLRQDPDIMLIGEIRDAETAQAVLNAALTGHLVLTTLHTNDAAGAVPRFLDLNAKPKILSSALNAVVAQRLVRKLCASCKKPSKRTGEYAAAGCPACSQTGYKGRTGIFEILVVDEKMERLIDESPSHQEVLDFAKKEGFKTMYQDGIKKVAEGVTTHEEVERVTRGD